MGWRKGPAVPHSGYSGQRAVRTRGRSTRDSGRWRGYGGYGCPGQRGEPDGSHPRNAQNEPAPAVDPTSSNILVAGAPGGKD
jgi:hypothetical protein